MYKQNSKRSNKQNWDRIWLDEYRQFLRLEPGEAFTIETAQVIGFLKGKRAIAIARQFGGKERTFTGEHFWARGYAVSTVGFELEQIRAYMRKQEDDEPADRGKF